MRYYHEYTASTFCCNMSKYMLFFKIFILMLHEYTDTFCCTMGKYDED